MIRPLIVEKDWAFLTSKTPMKLVEDTCGFVLEFGERIVAAIVFDSWSANSVHVSLIVEPEAKEFRDRFIELACGYAFSRVGYVFCFVPADNVKSFKRAESVGFVEKCRLPEARRPGVDYIIMGMSAEDCRYLRGQDNASR